MSDANEVKHTPLPWKELQPQTNAPYGQDMGWGIVAVEPMRGRIDSQITGMSEVDAKFIVAAVNSYPSRQRLVEALHTVCRAFVMEKATAAEELAALKDAYYVARTALADIGGEK